MPDLDKDTIITLEPAGVGNTPADTSNMRPAVETLTAETSDPVLNIDEEDPRDIATRRRMRRTTFQARLGRRLDTVRRRVLDNNLRLSANPTDMLRISVKRDERSRDLQQRTLETIEVMPIIFPKLEDLPLRHLEGYREGNEVVVPSLYTIDQKEYFEIYSPVECKLSPDDLLVRIIYDDVNCKDNPYVLILQVSEQLATIGYSSIVYYKFWVTIYDEKLPSKIVDAIKSDQVKRALLKW